MLNSARCLRVIWRAIGVSTTVLVLFYHQQLTRTSGQNSLGAVDGTKMQQSLVEYCAGELSFSPHS